MNRIMKSIAILGWAALVGSASIAYAGEAAEAGNDGWIITVNFIGDRLSAVTLNYQLDEHDTSAKSAITLLESLKRKLTERGFELLNKNDDLRQAVHGYEVIIVGDTVYSAAAHRPKRRNGYLMAMIVEGDKLALVNGIPVPGNDLDYQQIEKMADEIIARL